MHKIELETGQSDRAAQFYQGLSAMLADNPVNPTYEYPAATAVSGTSSWYAGTPREPALPENIPNVVLSSPFATPLMLTMTNIGVGFEALVRGDMDTSRRTYDALLQHSGKSMLIVAVDRLLGQLAYAIGDIPKAAGHFEDALEFCRKAGYTPEYTWSCWGFASALLERREFGDKGRAEVLLSEALETAKDLGMPPLLARVEELASSIGEPSAPVYPEGLTQREVEVLRLVAAGKTDREIAEELIIAIRTVTTHVGNILNKTGASNRAEAASFATRHGLD